MTYTEQLIHRINSAELTITNLIFTLSYNTLPTAQLLEWKYLIIKTEERECGGLISLISYFYNNMKSSIHPCLNLFVCFSVVCFCFVLFCILFSFGLKLHCLRLLEPFFFWPRFFWKFSQCKYLEASVKCVWESEENTAKCISQELILVLKTLILEGCLMLELQKCKLWKSCFSK